MANVTLKGSPFAISGELPSVGTQAPDFRLVNSGMEDMSLASFAGKRKIVSIVPSLDTGICQISTRKFNEKAAALQNTVVLIVSVDTPFAMKRFCDAEGIEGVHTLSTLRTKAFAKDYGTLMTEGPLEGAMCRAVVVLDESDKILYTQLVPEIAEEPDYDAALAALG